MKDLMEALNRAHKLDENFDDFEEQDSNFYHRAEKELEKHFNCTGAYLEPSTQNGMGRTFLFADDMYFDGSFDFETGEDYIFEDDFDSFLALCKNSFKPDVNESLNEAKTGQEYKGYILCYGCHDTDRWYIKNSKSEFVGVKSGYSSEPEAREAIDEIAKS